MKIAIENGADRNMLVNYKWLRYDKCGNEEKQKYEHQQKCSKRI